MLVAKVEPEYLLIHIAFKVERFNADVRSIQAPFQARPEILHAVRVDVIPNITLDMIDDFVGIRILSNERIAGVLIGDDVRSRFDIVLNRRPHGFELAVWNHSGPHLAAAL